ncbi:hypothetical protein GQ457_18G002110 [Hibiscus cannabinus]
MKPNNDEPYVDEIRNEGLGFIYFERYNDSRVKIGAVAGDYGKLLISIFLFLFEQFIDMVAYMLSDKRQSFRPCGICTLTDHPTDYCPCLQVHGVGNFPGPPQMPYDPYGDTYNSEWQDHPNFSYAQNSWPNSTYQPYQPEKSSLELMIEDLAINQEKIQNQFQEQMAQFQEQMAQFQNQTQDQIEQLVQSETWTNSCFQETEKHMSKIAEILERLESQEKLPSKTELNPKENVSVITPRSETVVEPPIQEQKEAEKSLNSGSQEEGDAVTSKEGSATPEPEASPYVATTKEGSPTPKPEASPYATQPPFPVRFIEEDNRAKEKENLDVFRKGEVYIPLLKVIREMPRYAHFLKELCANTIKFFGQEKVNLGEYISMVLTRRFPPKIKDQDMVVITRKIDKISLKEVLSWSKLQCL